jgi:gamma-glutamylaminecyclotransferase
MPKLFVFGTLKKGYPLHRTLEGATYLGPRRTWARYPMFVAGPWFAPMMLDQAGVGLQVSGELYEIDEGRLALLDDVESVGKPGNTRGLIQLEPMNSEFPETVWAYFKSPELAEPRHTDYLDVYRDRRFIPPTDREC